MASVPLFIEKIYNTAVKPKLLISKLYRFPITRPLAVKAAGRKLLGALGGRIRYFGIGGSTLSPETEKFLHDAGFPYTIGYGLTEAAPLVTGTKVRRFPIQCTGRPSRGISIRIVKHAASSEPGTGEIQVKGANVMLGYYNDKERTAEAFTQDGWLRTGDLGKVGKGGRLFISGRLKTVILGPSGENIYPEEIESLLGSSSLVEDAIVYSGEKGELVALVNLSEAARAAAGAVENALEDLRSWVNKKLASFSRISRIVIKNEPFEKTPTMKIKRYLYV
jgi:long-chain acyl-CoA synthetase